MRAGQTIQGQGMRQQLLAQVLMGHALPLLERMSQPSDIAVVNFGAWHGSGDSADYQKLVKEFADAVAEKGNACRTLSGRRWFPHTMTSSMACTQVRPMFLSRESSCPWASLPDPGLE